MVSDYYFMCGIVLVAEPISDWIKHSFITKFNFIKSTAYFDYALILSGDVTGIGHEGLNLDHTHAAVKQLGLANKLKLSNSSLSSSDQIYDLDFTPFCCLIFNSSDVLSDEIGLDHF